MRLAVRCRGTKRWNTSHNLSRQDIWNRMPSSLLQREWNPHIFRLGGEFLT